MQVNSGQGVARPQATVTLRFTQAILQSAERMGLALPADLVQAVQAEDRVALALQDRLWQTFCAQADDSLVGVQLGLALQVGHLDAAGMLLMTCENLGEALESLLEYHPIVGEGGSFALRSEAGCRVLVYTPHYSVCVAQRVEAVFACLLNMTRWTTGDAFVPQGLSLAHAARAEPGRYTELLGTGVVFDAGENALRFPVSALALPLIQANPEVCRHLHGLADTLLAALGGQSLSAQVGQLLRAQPRWGKERVAERLGMSGRHLVRRLAEEGTSFKLLRTALLREMAEQGLRDNARTAELAERLGFSDESAFAKAFKRWAGMTPAQFRDAAA